MNKGFLSEELGYSLIIYNPKEHSFAKNPYPMEYQFYFHFNVPSRPFKSRQAETQKINNIPIWDGQESGGGWIVVIHDSLCPTKHKLPQIFCFHEPLSSLWFMKVEIDSEGI